MRFPHIIIGMIPEYLTILKLRIAGLNKSVPSQWAVGEKDPVVVIPGLNETFWFLRKLTEFLNSRDHPIHIITPFSSTDKISNPSDIVGNYIKEHDLKNVIFLTHSKGGIVAKYLMTFNQEINSRIQKVIAVAAPFGGSIFGHLRFGNLHELKPKSLTLSQLQRNVDVNKKIISLFPLFDNHVVPGNSSILEGAENIQIPVVGHTVILESELTIKILKNYF